MPSAPTSTVPARKNRPMPETTVLAERYELHEVIGRGGMADVYRATDRALSRRAFVRLLRSPMCWLRRGRAGSKNQRQRETRASNRGG